jgi:hypothetical protein
MRCAIISSVLSTIVTMGVYEYQGITNFLASKYENTTYASVVMGIDTGPGVGGPEEVVRIKGEDLDTCLVDGARAVFIEKVGEDYVMEVTQSGGYTGACVTGDIIALDEYFWSLSLQSYLEQRQREEQEQKLRDFAT